MVITFQLFLMAILICSVLTGLVVESIKTLMTEHGKTCLPNTMAAICSVAVAACVVAFYVVLNNVAFGRDVIVYGILLAGASWLCAMVGYDKVMQAIEQVIGKKGE